MAEAPAEVGSPALVRRGHFPGTREVLGVLVILFGLNSELGESELGRLQLGPEPGLDLEAE
jgi:hypothetical protein